MGNMLNKYQQMVSELSNDQGNEGSWIECKLNNIRLKRLHDINNKIEILESQQENQNKEELKAKGLKKTYYEFAKGRQGEGRKPNKYTEGLGTFEDQGEGRKPNKYTEGLGTFEDQGEGRKPNKYTKGMGTFEDQGEGRKPNKYTEGMGTFKDQADGLVDHFRTSATGMDIASKHASTNKALKEIKKEDDDFPIV
ncbi:hypothetical protein Tco_0471624 [Tanacetum coccineum]